MPSERAFCQLAIALRRGMMTGSWKTPRFQCGGADESFERRKRRADARLKLAFLKRHDQIVESYHAVGDPR